MFSVRSVVISLNSLQNMIKNIIAQLRKWIPALVMMGVIFWFSSQPSTDLPNFDWADKIVKKGGHMLGYAILAWSYWYAFDMQSNQRWLAWLLAIFYAVTDEIHQSYVPGRTSSMWDVLIFDNLGALISLWVANKTLNKKRSDQPAPNRYYY